jgi:hypothetical protein
VVEALIAWVQFAPGMRQELLPSLLGTWHAQLLCLNSLECSPSPSSGLVARTCQESGPQVEKGGEGVAPSNIIAIKRRLGC